MHFHAVAQRRVIAPPGHKRVFIIHDLFNQWSGQFAFHLDFNAERETPLVTVWVRILRFLALAQLRDILMLGAVHVRVPPFRTPGTDAVVAR